MLDAPKYLRLCSIPVPEIYHFDPYYWTLDRKQIYSRSCLCCVYANCLMCNIQYVYLYWYCSHAWSKGTLTMFWCVLDCKQISCLRTQNSFSSLWSLLFNAWTKSALTMFWLCAGLQADKLSVFTQNSFICLLTVSLKTADCYECRHSSSTISGLFGLIHPVSWAIVRLDSAWPAVKV